MTCRRFALVLGLAACGSSTSAPSAPTTPAPATAKPTGPSEAELQAQHDQQDQSKHDEVVAAHRKIEEQQQDALGATCTEPEPRQKHERCLPSCYSTEPPDARAGKKLSGAVEIEHLVCQPRVDGGELGGFLFADE